MSDTPFTNFPELDYSPEHEPPRSAPAPAAPSHQNRAVEAEIALIRTHHAHIAKGIELFWGHEDCVDYLQQLILNGGDGVSRTRLGFKHEVVEALFNLIALQEAPPGP